MSTEREDGPVKHYRMKCDSCGKLTKRFAYEFWFERDAPPGWKEVVEDGWSGGIHHCPKCAGNTKTAGKTEIIPKTGDGFEISDHDAAPRPPIRQDNNTLVIDCQDGCKLVITSKTKIKVEQIEE